MKQRFGILSGLILSLFLPAYYRDVARNWRGIGFLFVLVLMTLTWIPVLWKWQKDASNFVDQNLGEVLKDLPTITIKKGEVSSDVPQPYIKKDGDKTIFVLDTTGQFNNLDETPAIILLTKNTLFVRDEKGGPPQVIPLKDIESFEFSKEWVEGVVAAGVRWFGVAAFLPVMGLSMIRALILMLLAGVVGLIFKMAINPSVDYGALVRMAAMGLALPTYIDTAALMNGIWLPYWFFATLGIASLYVIFGTAFAGPRPATQPEETAPVV